MNQFSPVSNFQALQQAIAAQQDLISSTYATQRAATGRLMLKSMLLQVVQVFNKLTEAAEGSIFLLDESGVVVESVLARGATMRTLKRNLIGQVLDKGLAGWVVKHQTVGVIDDTTTDDRWLTLPYEPYTVRSVLCFPILKQKERLGVVTLMHPEPHHFSQLPVVEFVPDVARMVALVLDNLRLQVELAEAIDPQGLDGNIAPEIADLARVPISENDRGRPERDLTGLYIITVQGKFLYANSRLAELFDYPFDELVTLDSIFELVEAGDCDRLRDDIQRCLRGDTRSFVCKVGGACKYGDRLSLCVEGNHTRFYGKPAIVGVIAETEADAAHADA